MNIILGSCSLLAKIWLRNHGNATWQSFGNMVWEVLWVLVFCVIVFMYRRPAFNRNFAKNHVRGFRSSKTRTVFLPRRIISNFYNAFYINFVYFLFLLEHFYFQPKPSFSFPKILYWHVFLPLSEIKLVRFWRLLSFHVSAYLTLLIFL